MIENYRLLDIIQECFICVRTDKDTHHVTLSDHTLDCDDIWPSIGLKDVENEVLFAIIKAENHFASEAILVDVLKKLNDDDCDTKDYEDYKNILQSKVIYAIRDRIKEFLDKHKFSYKKTAWKSSKGNYSLLIRDEAAAYYIAAKPAYKSMIDFSGKPSEEDAERAPYYRLKNYLNNILISTRNSHPSFVLMKKDEIDERLFPQPVIAGGQDFAKETGENCIQGLPSLGRTESGEKTSPVWEIIRDTWDSDKIRNVVLTGGGGIGKTVALFSITQSPDGDIPVPAVYVPMYDLIKDNECLDLSTYFTIKYKEYGADIGKLATEVQDMQPSMLVLLDGFNEIPANVRRKALSKVNSWYSAHPDVQIIAVSRPMDGIDLAAELGGDPIEITLAELEDDVIISYLNDMNQEIPAKEDPVWKVLRYPLFLNLYVKTSRLKGKSSAGYPLYIREPQNAGSLIWNFLQRELLRKSSGDFENNENWVLHCAFACEYILPFIAYNMFKNNHMTISHEELVRLTDEAIEGFDPDNLPHHLDDVQAKYIDEHDDDPFLLSSVDKKQWYNMVRRDAGLLVSLGSNNRGRGNQKGYAFVHQIFRDCLAGLHLVNSAQEGKSALPMEWMESVHPLVLDYAADLIDTETAEKLWELNRIYKQYKAETKVGNASTYNQLELNRRLGISSEKLDFSGMDLRGMSLTNYMGIEKYNLGLFRKPELAKRAHLDRKVFESSGHRNQIGCVLVLKDGRIVSASEDSTIRIWDSNSGECLLTLEGIKGRRLVQTEDGRIVSLSSDSSIRIWDPDTGECLRILGGQNYLICSFSMLRDGRLVSGSADGTLRIWNINTGVCDMTLSVRDKTFKGFEGAVLGLAELQGGRIASGSNALRIWDIETGECLTIQEEGNTYFWSVAELDNGSIVSASPGAPLCLWNSDNGECLMKSNENCHLIPNLVVLRDGCVATNSWNSIYIFNKRLDNRPKELINEEFEYDVCCFIELSDGRIVGGLNDGNIKIWNADTGECLMTTGTHNDAVTCLAELPDGRIVSGSKDGCLGIWDSVSGKCLTVLEGHFHGVEEMIELQSGLIVSGSYKGIISIWDLKTQECIKTYAAHNGSITYIRELGDGNIISYATDRTLRIWRWDTGECIWEINQYPDLYLDSSLKDGRIVTSTKNGTTITKQDGTDTPLVIKGIHHAIILCDDRIAGISGDAVFIIDQNTGKYIMPMEPPSSDRVRFIAELPEGKIVGCSLQSNLYIWSTRTGNLLMTFGGNTGYIRNIGILRNGNIASGSDNGTLRIWSSESGECIRVIDHPGPVRSLLVLQSGLIATGTTDSTICIWDPDTGKCVEVLKKTDVDVSEMDFSEAIMDSDVAELLRQNRAIVPMH